MSNSAVSNLARFRGYAAAVRVPVRMGDLRRGRTTREAGECILSRETLTPIAKVFAPDFKPVPSFQAGTLRLSDRRGGKKGPDFLAEIGASRSSLGVSQLPTATLEGILASAGIKLNRRTEEINNFAMSWLAVKLYGAIPDNAGRIDLIRQLSEEECIHLFRIFYNGRKDLDRKRRSTETLEALGLIGTINRPSARDAQNNASIVKAFDAVGKNEQLILAFLVSKLSSFINRSTFPSLSSILRRRDIIEDQIGDGD